MPSYPEWQELKMKKLGDISLLLLFSIASGKSLVFTMRTLGFASPMFALVATFTTLGFTGLCRPLLVMKPPRFLQQVRSWELEGALYRVLGVHSFGTLLRRSPLRYFNSKVYLSRWPGDPDAVCAQMEAAEAAHLWAMLLMFPYLVYVAIQGKWSTVFWFIVLNVGINVYPILHLRLARGRLMRARERKLVMRSRRECAAMRSAAE